MAIIKCKMCGGNLYLDKGACTAECEYCGSIQTVPKADDEKKLALFARAHHLRASCEFDKAAGIYEAIVTDFPEEAEAYWGLVLCKYGIEYVDDPATGKKIPTCHRSSFDNVLTDSDFAQALTYANPIAAKVYQEEANQINEIRKGIISVSVKEDPYDIFICYKETDENGQRTLDSVLAQDVYSTLTNSGYRVFFSRISLEDKLGMEYEPYIFGALHSAKIMLVIGTDPAHFNAVWVRNEWSRFLKFMAKGKDKHLIPCYKGMDPYDMPQEFTKLQAQDLSKIGAMQDILRGVEKLLLPSKKVVAPQQAVTGSNTAPLLERAFMFLEDQKWANAVEYCEKVLDLDPKNVNAYLGKLMAELHIRKQEYLKDHPVSFAGNDNYQKILRFADDDLKATMVGYIEHIRNREAESKYNQAKQQMASAKSRNAYEKVAKLFEALDSYKDSASLMQECLDTAAAIYARNEGSSEFNIYQFALLKMNSNEITDCEAAIKLFASIPGWKDADEKLAICQQKYQQLKQQQQADMLAKQRQADLEQKEYEIRKKDKRQSGLILLGIGLLVLILLLMTK